MPVMAEVAKFCRARQAICHHAEAVPQVALLFSTVAHYRRAAGLFSRELSRLNGTLQALLESQQSVEVLGEHHLSGRLAKYPIIVVPEWESIDPKFKDELVNYVKDGGKLLLVGPATAALFATELGITLEGEMRPELPLLLTQSGIRAKVKARSQAVKLGPQATPFGELRWNEDASSAAQPAASVTSVGRGEIAAAYFTFGKSYLGDRSVEARRFLDSLVRRLFPNPLVEVKGSADVDVVVHRIGGKLAVNLVNTAGPHADRNSPIVDSIPPVGPLQIAIRATQPPARVVVEPGGQPLEFEHKNGAIQVTLPKLEIHNIVVVE
jgi:hypothetical protein